MVARRAEPSLLGPRRQQGRRVGMLRGLEQCGGAAVLDDLPGIHHQDAPDGVGDHAHIVGDQDEAHAAIALEREQQLQDLRLNGHVERGRRLVRDQNLRVACDRHGDHHPLVHAAGKLMRIGPHALLGRRDAHLLQQRDGPAARRPAAHPFMDAQTFNQLKPDREAGIEAGGGLLEDHGDALAGKLASLAGGQRQEIATFERQPIGRDPPRIRHEPHHGQHGEALAGAGLAHDPEQLALGEARD